MIAVLVIILMLFMFLLGGDRGVVSFITLCCNFILIIVTILFIFWGMNPLIVTFISCTIISAITLFYQNGENSKTFASFVSVMIIMILLFAFANKIGYSSHMQGFSEEKQLEDEMSGLSININISMAKVAVSVIIMGLIGAILDTSIAVSSSVYEVYKNNKHLSMKELFLSGIHIGSDIIGTTANTLFFAYLGEFLMLMIRFKAEHYSLGKIMNSKAFAQEFIHIIFSGIGCVLIIPLTSFMIAYVLTRHNKFKRLIEDDSLFTESDSQQEIK